VLGAPYVDIDGNRVAFPLRKAEAITYYLAIEKRASRDALCSMLWPDKEEGAAQNSLRSALYVLNKVAPSAILMDTRKTIRIGPCRCDLDAITLLPDLATPIPGNIYGKFMSGFRISDSPQFDEWIASHEMPIRKKLTDQLRLRIEAGYEAENFVELHDSLDALLDLDPFDEDSVMELIELHIRQGRSAKAMELFSTYRKRLDEALGLAPSARAESFFRDVFSKKTIRKRTADEDAEHFCGREKAMSDIADFLSRTTDSPKVVFIHGEPGVGKTSLVRKAVSSIPDERKIVFTVQGYQADQPFPFAPWRKFVAHMAGMFDMSTLPLNPVELAAIGGAFPELAHKRKFNSTCDMGLMSESDPPLLGKTLSDIALEIAGPRCLVMVFEDLHWFDSQSLQLLHSFLASMRVATSVFATSRPEGVETQDALFGRLRRTNSLDYLSFALPPFTKDETLRFCRVHLREERIEEKGEDFFQRESEGLPLLLVELVRCLADDVNGNWKGDLGAAILTRMGAMREQEKRFLQVLSLFPQPTSLSVLASVMEETSLRVTVIAEKMLRKGLVEEGIGGDGIACLGFRHEKIRECVYGSLPLFRREVLHRRIGHILSEAYRPEVWNPSLSAALCHHYVQAGLHEKALEQNLKEMYFNITLNHELFPMAPDWIFRSFLMPYSSRLDTEQRMDQVRDLLHVLNRKEENVPEVLRMEGTYLELRGGYHIGWGQYREGRTFINRALRIAEKNGFDEIKIRCLQHVGHNYLQTDNWEQLLPCAREMLRVSRETGRDDYAGVALRFIGVALQLKGDHRLAEKAFRQSIAVFELLREVGKHYPLCILSAWCYIGEMHHWRGELTEALECFERCVRGCEEADFVWGCGHFHAHAADVALDMRNFDLLYDHVDKGIEIFERSRGGRCGSILYSMKAIVDARRGNFEQARRSLERGDILCNPIRKRSWSAVQAMAKTYVAAIAEKTGKRRLLSGVCDKASPAYAEEAMALYESLPVPHRVEFLKKISDGAMDI
jgi:DNA-binding SARP family transcriptional activator/tetratricopeptide (TPR) repeat protein